MSDRIVEILKAGGVGVLLTDTLYGLVGRAFDENAVARIYSVKKRNDSKPFIVLISSIQDLELFDLTLDGKNKETLKKLWSETISVLLPCPLGKFKYLHRGTEMLAFRLPQKEVLVNLLKKTGPLVAPSANPEGLPPAKNIREAKKYFGGNVDFYEDGGVPRDNPSTVVSLRCDKVKVIRG